MLGMFDFVLTVFNAYLSIEAEKVLVDKWDVRKYHVKHMGLEFSAVFSNVGTNKAGRDYKAVIPVLSTLFYH